MEYTTGHDPYTLHPTVRIELYEKLLRLKLNVPMSPVILDMTLRVVECIKKYQLMHIYIIKTFTGIYVI
jgi:hypothetical protein